MAAGLALGVVEGVAASRPGRLRPGDRLRRTYRLPLLQGSLRRRRRHPASAAAPRHRSRPPLAAVPVHAPRTRSTLDLVTDSRRAAGPGCASPRTAHRARGAGARPRLSPRGPDRSRRHDTMAHRPVRHRRRRPRVRDGSRGPVLPRPGGDLSARRLCGGDSHREARLGAVARRSRSARDGVVGGLLVGWLTLRLKGFNLAIATLAINLIMLVVVVQDAASPAVRSAHRRPALDDPRRRPVRTEGLLLDGALRALTLSILVARNIKRSRIGRALRAIGVDEEGGAGIGARIRCKLS